MATVKTEKRQSKLVAPARAKTVLQQDLLPVAEKRGRLPDLAYQLIEEAIVTLRLPPGIAVSEQTLMDMTGIGRTPIREAIQRLAREHLVIVLPQRGLLIADIDLNRQLKLLEIRREIERLICRSAAKRANEAERARFADLADQFSKSASENDDIAFIRADKEFNELSLTTARNEFAEGALRTLHGMSRRFWYLHYKQTPDMPEMARLHADVATSIAKRDIGGAGDALDRLVDHIEQYTRETVLGDR